MFSPSIHGLLGAFPVGLLELEGRIKEYWSGGQEFHRGLPYFEVAELRNASTLLRQSGLCTPGRLGGTHLFGRRLQHLHQPVFRLVRKLYQAELPPDHFLSKGEFGYMSFVSHWHRDGGPLVVCDRLSIALVDLF